MRSDLLTLAQHLHALPNIEHVRVFGSAVTRPDTAGDLDLALCPPPGTLKDPSMQATIGELLQAARRWYGALDPFVLTAQGTLNVRSDDANRWQLAKNAHALALAIQQGEPFPAWYARVITPRLTVTPAPEDIRRPRLR